MKHLRNLSGEEVSLVASLKNTPRPTIFQRLAGRRRVLFSPPPATQLVITEMYRLVDERFGLALCPECGHKVAVLVRGVCRDCGPEVA